MSTLLLAVQSYSTDRRGNIIQDTKVEHAKLSDAIAAKQKDSTIMVFVRCDAAKLAEVNAFVDSKGFATYPTKNKGSYLLGYKAGSSSATIECAVE